jgi:hypothetical protein
MVGISSPWNKHIVYQSIRISVSREHRYHFLMLLKLKNLPVCDFIRKTGQRANLGAWPRLPLQGTSGQAQLECWNTGIMGCCRNFVTLN